MKLGLNMGSLNGLGSAYVGKNVLRGLAFSSSPKHQFIAWVANKWAKEAEQLEISNLTVVPARNNKLWHENIVIRRDLRRFGVDKLFSLGDTSLPLPRRPHLLLVQLAYLALHQGEWGFGAAPRFRAKMKVIETYFQAGLHGVDLFTVQTSFMQERLSERWRIPLDRIRIIPSSVDPAVLERVHSPAPRPYICYVAAPAPQKNHAVLAPLMASLIDRWPELTCRVTVRSQDVPALVEEATKLGVLKHIEFLGNVSASDALTLMQHAVALVMPSRLESFGLPYYEAMAMGCPVVAADTPFAREACGPNGLYANIDSGESFAAHVEALLGSTDALQSCSASAKERFHAVYQSWADIGAQYLNLLESL